jgi:bifunctional DNA-binding transcriptional regulator/antitoxin component of YhaV-PrlF toxin-antitoxin module
MPQLVKGGKWVFGWVLVGRQGELAIPPEAWDEYGFQAGDEVTFIAGSRRSGGFGLSHSRLLAEVTTPLQVRALAQGRVDEKGRLVVPPTVGFKPGDRLLAVRGSGRALGFVARPKAIMDSTSRK